MRVDVLGVGFDDVTILQAVEWSRDVINNGGKSYIVTPNPEIVWMARSDEALSGALNQAGLVLPDGAGVVLAARILKTPLKERIPGIDFIASLLSELSGIGGSVFLFGAKPGVAEEAGRKLEDEYPGLVISGVADGYFTDDGHIIERINASSPDLLLVCLGAPKQELWMTTNINKISARLCAGLGGSLDIFAGNVKRAPAFFRKLGLEWLYRLAREPRRIGRMIKLPLFLLAVLLERARGK